MRSAGKGDMNESGAVCQTLPRMPLYLSLLLPNYSKVPFPDEVIATSGGRKKYEERPEGSKRGSAGNLAFQHQNVQHLQLRIMNGRCIKIHVFLFLFHNTSSGAPPPAGLSEQRLFILINDSILLASFRYDPAALGGRAQSTPNPNHI